MREPSTPQRATGVRHDDTPSAVLPFGELSLTRPGSEDEDFPDVPIPSLDGLIPSRMVWSILHVMQQGEGSGVGEEVNGASLPLSLPPGFDSGHRAVIMNFIIGLASSLSLSDYTLHLAAALVDKYIALQRESIAPERMQIIGATCLKVADVFVEQSKEYYKQENIVEYAQATLPRASAAELLSCEKDILPSLGFDLRLPTAHWFLQCYLAYGRFCVDSSVARTAFFISDLTLLDHDALVYAPSLRAQCALLVAVFVAQQSLTDRRRLAAQSRVPVNQRVDGSTPCGYFRSEPTPSGPRVPHAGSLEPCDLGSAGACLDHWDEYVRDHVCKRNTAIDASMCLQAVVRILMVMRREWKGAKLDAAEAKHAALVRTLVYPERFPVSKLAQYIIPDCQRGLLP